MYYLFHKIKKFFLTLNTQDVVTMFFLDVVTIKELFSTSETLIAIMNNNNSHYEQ